MKTLFITYLILTGTFIAIAYKVKDDYFYLPYPNAINYILALILLIITIILLIGRKHRNRKMLIGFSSIVSLLVGVNGMNYCFEWHPLGLPLPFTKSQSVEVSYEPYAWKTAKPARFGYNEDSVKQYLNEIDNWKMLRGLVVIKDGKIILEKYKDGATKYSAFNVHSVTKSITSALTGIALQKRLLTSENQYIMPFFSEYKENGPTNRSKNSITVAHLLSMRGGFTGGDGPQSVEQVIVNERVSKDEIGHKFHYFTGSHMVISAIITKTSNSSTKAFAQQQLFKPLGIQCAFWRKVDGYYAGGDETYFTARDLARFGYLYLNKGAIDGVQLVDSSWINKSFTSYTTQTNAFRNLDCYQETGYGYSWWLLTYGNKIIYTARGKGGQYILIMPEQKVLAIVLQEWKLGKDFKRENAYLCKLLSLLTTDNKKNANLTNGSQLRQITVHILAPWMGLVHERLVLFTPFSSIGATAHSLRF